MRRTLQLALYFVGRGYEDRGDLRAALDHFRAWREEAAGYAAIDPRNADWQRDLAIASSFLAEALRVSGDAAGARTLYREALGRLGPIAGASPTQTQWQRDLAVIELGLGLTMLDLGDVREAQIRAASVEKLTAPLLARGIDRDAARTGAEGRLLDGDAAARRGDVDQARRSREAALSLVPPSPSATVDKRTLAVTARALQALHRSDEARALADRLLALGYRHPSFVKIWPR